MTLPEVLMASSLAVFLLGLLLVWYMQGEKVIKESTLRSEELQELNQAMKGMTETLQEGAVYLLEPHAQIVVSGGEGASDPSGSSLPGENAGSTGPASRLLVERFMEGYRRRESHEFLLEDGYLLQRMAVKGPGGEQEPSTSPSGVLLETGQEEKVLASNIKNITFSCPTRGILEITLKGETLLLKTQVRVKEGKEEE